MKWTKPLLFSILFFAPAVALADLTGTWNCNDGGRYYVRQLGKEIYWYGERATTNPSWSNVASGHIDGGNIILRWADVPKGTVMQKGVLILKLDNPRKFRALTKTGGFGGSVWTRQ